MNKKEFDGIINMAIAAEIDAYEFYKEVATTVSEPSLKILFQEFADEEKGHKTSLESIKEKEIRNFSFSAGADYKISEAVELPKLSMTMKPADAVALAMKKEEEAMKVYSSLATATNDPEKQRVFASLAQMEEGHKIRMEGLYNQTAFPEVW